MKIKKKGEKGAAKNFITRTQAVRRLQISLADFRRLCIFKGIYPREPRNKKKANKGKTSNTTFYYVKDIQYLMHEPVLQKFREHKTFARKLTRALGRGEVSDAKRLDDNRPRYRLDNIIKERYPTFQDALRDLDDPLSMLFLFAAMPATDKISQRVTEDAERLCNQWMAFVARQGLLTKVFVSIKGIYYEAKIRGETIMWLVPFKFPQNIPSDVDFRVMLTFLEFYTVLMQFVLYRLYSEAELVYPPPIDTHKLKGIGGITAYLLASRNEAEQGAILPAADEAIAQETAKGKRADNNKARSIDLSKAAQADAEHADDDSEDEDVDDEDVESGELDTFAASAPGGDELAQPKSSGEGNKRLFSGMVFYVGREVPIDVLEFILTAFGGKVISESALDEMVDNEDKKTSNDVQAAKLKQVNLDSVTHQICDRPSVPNRVPGRAYVQPQWVFDSINKNELLGVAEYAPGESLPPHLSPWGDAGRYNPENPFEGEEGAENAEEEAEADAGDDGDDEDDEDEEEDEEEDEDEDEEELEYQRELESEAKGVKQTTKKGDDKKSKPKKRSAADKEAEEKELRKMMMSNKQQKLYNKMQYGNAKKQARDDELRKKRRKLEEAKKKLKATS